MQHDFHILNFLFNCVLPNLVLNDIYSLIIPLTHLRSISTVLNIFIVEFGEFRVMTLIGPLWTNLNTSNTDIWHPDDCDICVLGLFFFYKFSCFRCFSDKRRPDLSVLWFVHVFGHRNRRVSSPSILLAVACTRHRYEFTMYPRVHVYYYSFPSRF